MGGKNTLTSFFMRRSNVTFDFKFANLDIAL